MRNRAALGVRVDPEHVIFVYQHWAPDQLFKQYAEAFKVALPRIKQGDSDYAASIIVRQIVGRDWDGDWNGLTGFGLSVNRYYGTDHKTLILDIKSETVSLYHENWTVTSKPIFTISIDRFIEKYS